MKVEKPEIIETPGPKQDFDSSTVGAQAIFSLLVLCVCVPIEIPAVFPGCLVVVDVTAVSSIFLPVDGS